MKTRLLYPAVFLSVLTGCSRKPSPNPEFLAKNLYREVRDASLQGIRFEKSYPSGLVFLRNHVSPGDSDECFTTLILTRKWAIVGSSAGFGGKVRLSGSRWEDNLFTALWNHSCADASVAAMATEGFDFLRLENFMRKIQGKGFQTLYLVDLIILDSTSSSPPSGSGSWAKLRMYIGERVRRNPEAYSTLQLPTEKQLNWYFHKLGDWDAGQTPQVSRAKSGIRTQEHIKSIFEAGDAMFAGLQTRFPGRHVRFHGPVKFKVIVHPLGHVVDAYVVKSAIKYPALQLEMIRIIKSMNFGRIHSSRNDTLSFTYGFKE